MNSFINSIMTGDVLTRLRELPDESVHCVVTSPPYYALRDYGVAGQLGLERTPGEYIEKMSMVFREVRRVLRHDGTLWLNMGDCYAGSGKGRNADGTHSASDSKQGTNRGSMDGVLPRPNAGLGSRTSQKGDSIVMKRNRWCSESPLHTRWVPPPAGFKAKDLMGMPWRLAFALQDDGWWLREDIIWEKPNAMPGSQKDRPTTSHEYIFLFAKSQRYYYDHVAVQEQATGGAHGRGEGTYSKLKYPSGWDPATGHQAAHTKLTGRYRDRSKNERFARAVVDLVTERSLRSVWRIPTEAFPDAHFATFPKKLVEICLEAGTSPWCCSICFAPHRRLTRTIYVSERTSNGNKTAKRLEMRNEPLGSAAYEQRLIRTMKTIGWKPRCHHRADTSRSIVMDPFMGSGTTGVVAAKLGRLFVGIELNPKYVAIAGKRLKKEVGIDIHGSATCG